MTDFIRAVEGEEVLVEHINQFIDYLGSVAAGSIPYGTGTDTQASLALGTRGYVIAAGSSAPLYEPIARRNRLLNGDFLVWQRGTATPTATNNTYGPDRWRLLLGAGTAATINIEATDIPSLGSRAACKVAVGATVDNKFGIFQPIYAADIWDLRGATVSLQCKIKCSTELTAGGIRIGLLQWTSTENAVSATPINAWGIQGTNPTLTTWTYLNAPGDIGASTSWATFKYEGVVVSTSMTNLGVFIWNEDTSNTGGYFLVTDVQLEKGSVCTTPERRRFSETLEDCQFYYQKSHTYATKPGTAGTAAALAIPVWANPIATTSRYCRIFLQRPMRAAPTVVIMPCTTPANTSRISDNAGSDAAANSGVASEILDSSFSVINSTGGNIAIGDNLIRFSFTAESEI